MFCPLEFPLPQFMADVVKHDDDDFFTPSFVRPRVPCLFVVFHSLKKSRKDCSTRMLSLVPLSELNLKEEHFIEYIIPAKTMVYSAALIGEGKNILSAMNPFCFVMPIVFEYFLAQIDSDECLDIENLSLAF